MHRRNFVKLAGAAACGALLGDSLVAALPSPSPAGPTQCRYAPPGEYVKDHTFVRRDGWWHLYSISGTTGLSWMYSGNEETLSWSISRDLVSWDFRGHVLHASERENTFDEDMIWAPFCLEANGRYYMYYAACVHAARPLQYDRRGSFAKSVDSRGDDCSIGLATSDDLTRWTKVSDPVKGLGVPGRDPNVVRDEAHGRWLMYTTGVSVDSLSGSICIGIPRSGELESAAAMRKIPARVAGPHGRIHAGLLERVWSGYRRELNRDETPGNRPMDHVGELALRSFGRSHKFSEE